MRQTIFLLFAFFIAQQSNSQISTEERMISDFHQKVVVKDPQLAKCLNDKVWGNCVVIGLIKTAIVQFGTVANIYQRYEAKEGKLFITFNDGLSIELTRDELEQAEQFAKFGKAADAVYYDSAIIVYASICKRILVHKTGVEDQYKHCINSFTDALHFINSGYDTDSCGVLLGLKLVPEKLSNLPGLAAAIIRTRAHTAYCTRGVQDINGQRFIIKDGKMKNPASGPRPIKAVFTLSK